ncbi:MAG: ATP-binding cassette domain-containing protein [Pseudomonadota bacterium]
MTEQAGKIRMVRMLRPFLLAAGGFSLGINLLFLVAPLYMLQVYDRVLTTGSLPTLIFLSCIAVFLLGIYLFADAGRRRVMARASEYLGQELGEETLRRGFNDPRKTPADTLAAASSLNQVQQLLSQGLPGALFDLPFVPLFLGILFFVHPLIGAVSLIGALLIVALAVITERTTKTPLDEASQLDRRAQVELAQLVRQRGAVVGMGMQNRASARWSLLRRKGMDATLAAGVPATFLGAGTRSLRMILQIAVLATGAFLAIGGNVSAGAIIASSIIMGRGLAPIDQMVNAWRQYVSGWKAVGDVAAWVGREDHEPEAEPTPMPRPDPVVALEELMVGVPGGEEALLPRIDHTFPRGRMVAVLGSSGSGKTSLLHTIAGAWPPHYGTMRLGGRDLIRWNAEDRGRYVGYLPQHVELLRGTVFENIARFTETSPDQVFDAAKTVGCHDLILSLPDGYDTKIGDGGTVLSAGQRQAVGLARACFGAPPLMLLDEPTAHLDGPLAGKVMTLFAELSRMPEEERLATIFIATHDLRLLTAVDDVMVIKDRKIAITTRENYLAQVSELRRSRMAKGDDSALTMEINERRPESV